MHESVSFPHSPGQDFQSLKDQELKRFYRSVASSIFITQDQIKGYLDQKNIILFMICEGMLSIMEIFHPVFNVQVCFKYLCMNVYPHLLGKPFCLMLGMKGSTLF